MSNAVNPAVDRSAGGNGADYGQLQQVVHGANERPLPADVVEAPTQVGYDLRKLRGKGLVERVSGRHRYRATHEGIRVAAFLLKLRDGLLEPILGNRCPGPPARNICEPDRIYNAIAHELKCLCDHLGLRAA